MTNKEMENRILALEKQIKALTDTRSISRSQETAFKHRLRVLSANGPIGTFTQANLERTINLTGNAQSITVLEYPTQYIPLTIQGATKKIPLFDA